MLGRLRITQRLSLLLMLPLGAVVLISIPFAVDRADSARAAAAIVDSAQNARTVGAVIQELERERVLALGYLASDRLERSALVAQTHSTDDAANQARALVAGAATSRLVPALYVAEGLGVVRERALRRSVAMGEVYRTYHDAIVTLLDAMRLTDQRGADATGLRQMSSLDALLRLSEEANQVAAALIVATVDPSAAADSIRTSEQLERVYAERFQQEGDPGHVELLAISTAVPSAQQATDLADLIGSGGAAQDPISIDVALSVAETGVDIRRGVQNRVSTDIATGATRRAVEAQTAATFVAGLAAVLLALVIWLGIAVSRSVARPLRRITLAATAVADLAARELVRVNDVESDVEGPPRLAALTLRSADEIGELASAFNRVQATAALLMEQQITTRRNVSVMFANIANRTQSLVARQLAYIDALERDERDEQRLAHLYPLDHLTTRLRRSADSLLVIAGTRDQARIATPTSLGDVIRSAAAEVEGYQNIQLGAISDVTITAAGVPDLTLLLAELLENATAFSPPNVPVEVSASLQADCRVRITDRGIGMGPERFAEENARLISRERLDVAPTTMLGLFVVGRLARRHGISVSLVPTPVSGVTAEVVVPPELIVGGATRAAGTVPAPRPPSTGSAPPMPGALPRSANPPGRSGLAPTRVNSPNHGFGWFDGAIEAAPHQIPTANGSNPAPAEPARSGLRRRQRGATLTDADMPSHQPATRSVAPERDPEAERAGIEGFALGAARAEAEAHSTYRAYSPGPSTLDSQHDQRESTIGRPPLSPPAGATPLHRRRPGEHLAEPLRAEAAERRARRGQHRMPEPAPRTRDADAERAAMNGFMDGVARADQAHHPRDPWSQR